MITNWSIQLHDNVCIHDTCPMFCPCFLFFSCTGHDWLQSVEPVQSCTCHWIGLIYGHWRYLFLLLSSQGLCVTRPKNINLWWQVNPTKLSSLAFLYCKRAQTTSSPNAVLCKGELRNTQAPHQILAAAVSWSFFDPQLSLSLVGPAVSGARSQYGIAMHHAHPKVLAQKSSNRLKVKMGGGLWSCCISPVCCRSWPRICSPSQSPTCRRVLLRGFDGSGNPKPVEISHGCKRAGDGWWLAWKRTLWFTLYFLRSCLKQNAANTIKYQSAWTRNCGVNNSVVLSLENIPNIFLWSVMAKACCKILLVQAKIEYLSESTAQI